LHAQNNLLKHQEVPVTAQGNTITLASICAVSFLTA